MSDASLVTVRSTEDAPTSSAARRSRLDRLAAWTARALWLVVVPALASGVVLRYLVPAPAEALGTWAAPIARVAGTHRLAAAGLLFVVLSGVARHWSQWLPDAGESPVRSARQKNLGLVLALAVAGLLAFGLRSVVGFYEVLSASMLPTLAPEDLVRGVRGAFAGSGAPGELHRGDIIVFEKPPFLEGPAHVVKRVIGLPGDRISMKGPHAVINGREVQSCDAGPYFYPLSGGGGVAGRASVEFLGDRPHLAIFLPEENVWTETYEVKPGEVFVLGDNRSNSVDSRAWNGGKGAGLPVSAIVARVTSWLIGVQRNEHLDLAHAFRPLELSVRLDGIDTAELRAGIAACLAGRSGPAAAPGLAHDSK